MSEQTIATLAAELRTQRERADLYQQLAQERKALITDLVIEQGQLRIEMQALQMEMARLIAAGRASA